MLTISSPGLLPPHDYVELPTGAAGLADHVQALRQLHYDLQRQFGLSAVSRKEGYLALFLLSLSLSLHFRSFSPLHSLLFFLCRILVLFLTFFVCSGLISLPLSPSSYLVYLFSCISPVLTLLVYFFLCSHVSFDSCFPCPSLSLSSPFSYLVCLFSSIDSSRVSPPQTNIGCARVSWHRGTKL